MEGIVKASLVVILLSSLMCCSGISKEIYIGPYHVIFNDTDRPVYLVSLEKQYITLEDTETKSADIYPIYMGISSSNTSLTLISITEGDLKGNQIANLTSLRPNEGYIVIKRFDRVIDGIDANVAEFKNKSNGNISQLAAFAFKAPTACGYDPRNNIATVRIGVENYTESQFDRLLDTFTIHRLVND